MNPPPRPPISPQTTPAPISILWAHEIRRENIHLVNQLDTTRADLAATTTLVNDLRQELGELRQKIESLEGSFESKLRGLEAGFEGRVGAVRERAEALEIENGVLRGRVEVLERGVGLNLGVGGGSRWGTRAADTTRCKQPCPDSDVLVPDSMPVDDPSRADSAQTLSDTTWGSSSQSGEYEMQVMQTKQRDASDVVVNHTIELKQDGRTLLEYLRAEEPRGRCLTVEREAQVVEAFVKGLDDYGTRMLLERRLRGAGYSWLGLKAIVHGILGDGGRQTQNKGNIPRERAKETNSNDSKPKKRQRRCIPIIPADEDDLLEMMASHL